MELRIKQFGDLHFDESITKRKLEKISNKILENNPHYVIFTGDLIDSNSFIKNSYQEKQRLLSWLESIGKNTELIMALGNHDISSSTDNNKTWFYDYDPNFWTEISTIAHFLGSNPVFLDNNIYVIAIDLPLKYYENSSHKEDKAILLRHIELKQKMLTNLQDDKLNVLICHSPIYMTDPDVLEYLKEFNIIMAGHLHGGLTPQIIANLIPKNRGLITREKKLFPDNARGFKYIDISENQAINLIITEGITKIPSSNKIIRYLNDLFPSEVEEIEYDTETKKIKVKTLKI